MNALAHRIVANDLVPVYATDAEERVVDARELHKFLEVGRDFTNWIKDRIEKYGFVRGQDYFLTLTKIGERQNVTRHDYILKLDVAKELCMVENNEQGRKARKYFIEVEKRFKQITDTSKLSPELQMFHKLFSAMARTELQLAATNQRLDEVQEHVTTMQTILLQRDQDWRRSINSLLNGAAYRAGVAYREMRNQSYRKLEERGHCDLNARLRNLTKRLEDSGATKTQINDANKMDVIENDPRLKEIYINIVKELSVATLRVTT